MENVHSESYALLIDNYIKDPTEKDHLFRAISTVPAVEKKAAWATKWFDEDQMYQIAREAVEVERYFICEALPCSLIGMNSGLMEQYIECCADRLLNALGYDKIYNTKNPFEWMDLISVQGKTNFFEKRVGEYQKAGVMADRKEQVFQTSTEF